MVPLCRQVRERTTAVTGSNPQSDKNRYTAQERVKLALKLRLSGASMQDIADAGIGYSNKGSVSRAIKKALKDIPREEASMVLHMELERLDIALRAIWPKILQGDLWAIDRLVMIQNRRARYLGLDDFQQDDNVEEVKSALRDFIVGTKERAKEIEAAKGNPDDILEEPNGGE